MQSPDYSDSDTEDVQQYGKGGYHPVNIGDKFHNDRYIVEKKLGYGHFSTVWLASDETLPDDHEHKLVALKIQRSAQDYTDAAYDEIRLLTVVNDEADVHTGLGSKYVVRLLDHFEHNGPNGKHVCLVFETMGKNVLRLIKHYEYRGIPTYIVKIMTRQLLLGLDFLHKACQIIHTDLKPENFLMLPNIKYNPAELRAQRELFKKTGQMAPTSPTSPIPDPNGPQTSHLLSNLPDPHGVEQQLDMGVDPIALAFDRFTVKISDLGTGCWIHHHFTEDIATRQYRSPEVIVGLKYSQTADIWATACIIFELFTSHFLFDPKEDAKGAFTRNDDHLALIRELLGQYPPQYWTEGKFSKKFFKKNGEFFNIKSLQEWPLNSVLTDKYGFAEDEANSLVNTLLLPMLHLDPALRCSAHDALKSPWLQLDSVDIAAMYFDAGQIQRLPATIAKEVLEFERKRIVEVTKFVERTRATSSRLDRYIRKHAPYHVWLKEEYNESLEDALERIKKEIEQIKPQDLKKQNAFFAKLKKEHDISHLANSQRYINHTAHQHPDQPAGGDETDSAVEDEAMVDTPATTKPPQNATATPEKNPNLKKVDLPISPAVPSMLVDDAMHSLDDADDLDDDMIEKSLVKSVNAPPVGSNDDDEEDEEDDDEMKDVVPEPQVEEPKVVAAKDPSPPPKQEPQQQPEPITVQPTPAPIAVVAQPTGGLPKQQEPAQQQQQQEQEPQQIKPPTAVTRVSTQPPTPQQQQQQQFIAPSTTKPKGSLISARLSVFEQPPAQQQQQQPIPNHHTNFHKSKYEPSAAAPQQGGAYAQSTGQTSGGSSEGLVRTSSTLSGAGAAAARTSSVPPTQEPPPAEVIPPKRVSKLISMWESFGKK